MFGKKEREGEGRNTIGKNYSNTSIYMYHSIISSYFRLYFSLRSNPCTHNNTLYVCIIVVITKRPSAVFDLITWYIKLDKKGMTFYSVFPALFPLHINQAHDASIQPTHIMIILHVLQTSNDQDVNGQKVVEVGKNSAHWEISSYNTGSTHYLLYTLSSQTLVCRLCEATVPTIQL